MRPLAIISFLVLFNGIPHCGYSQNLQGKIDSLLGGIFQKDGPGGVVLAAKGDSVIYRKAFGKANLELNIDMKPVDVFRLGSVTKQFTAAAIIKLNQEGKLSLKDDITKFIPDYPTQGYTLTIENLLTHTSGIKDYTGMPLWTKEMQRKDLTPTELLDLFKKAPLNFPPGTQYRYSNSGYVILGYIIEQLTGEPYVKYLQDQFFTPLKMTNTHYDSTSELISNRVSGYLEKNRHYNNAAYLSMTLPYSAGGLVSNADDLFTWYRALNEQNLQKAFSSYHLKNGKPTGYGWEMGNIQDSPAIKHVGRINGFVTFVVYLTEAKIFVTILTNCECYDNLEKPASEIAALLLGKPFQLKRTELFPENLKAYSGMYKSEYDDQKIITLQDNQLVFYTKGGLKQTLIPCDKDKFFIQNTLTILKFKRSSEGKIVNYDFNDLGLPEIGYRTGQKTQVFKTMKVPENTLQKYTGDYVFETGLVLSIIKKDNRLYGQVGSDQQEIIPYDTDKFFAKNIDALLLFQKDGNGKITGLTKIQSDEMKAKKVDTQ